MPARKLPSDEVLRRWRHDEGMSIKDMHQRLLDSGIDCSLSAVSVALGRMGETDRIRYDDWLPWTNIRVEHNQAWEATMLRVGARLARGLNVPEQRRRLYSEWLNNVTDRGLVVAYREDRGFFYTKPRPGTRDGEGGIPVRFPPREGGEVQTLVDAI